MWVEADLYSHEVGRLMRNVAEDLKLPLTRILTAPNDDKQVIDTNVQAAIDLIDGLVLGAQVYNGQHSLDLQPVSLQAVMHNSLVHLSPFAFASNCTLKLSVSGRLGLTMAHYQALQAAVSSLLYSLIVHSNTTNPKKTAEIILTAKKDVSGNRLSIQTTAGVRGGVGLSSSRKLTGIARQTLLTFSFGSNAGILIAETLLAAMNSTLQFRRSKDHTRFSALLMPSNQLSLL